MSKNNNLASIWAERITACQASGINERDWNVNTFFVHLL